MNEKNLDSHNIPDTPKTKMISLLALHWKCLPAQENENCFWLNHKDEFGKGAMLPDCPEAIWQPTHNTSECTFCQHIQFSYMLESTACAKEKLVLVLLGVLLGPMPLPRISQPRALSHVFASSVQSLQTVLIDQCSPYRWHICNRLWFWQ